MLKNIKSWFIIEEEEPKKEAPKQAPKEQAKPVVENQATSAASQVNQDFLDILFKAMEDNNLNGFDYLEFKKSLQSLKKMEMDEATRYQSAFAMAQTMGATPEKLVQTAEHYLNVLQTEESKFQKAAANQQEKSIGSKEQEINQLEITIKTKAEQIKQLTQEIEQHREQTELLKKEIADASIKVETTRNNFVASYNALAGQITTDIENIKKFLK